MEESVLPPPVGTISEKNPGGREAFCTHCSRILLRVVFSEPSAFISFRLINRSNRFSNSPMDL